MRIILRALSKGKLTILAVAAALTLATASAALAGAGVGGVFNLGVTNTVNAITTLKGALSGPSLRIDNDSTNTAATALQLLVEPGKAPMKVNSSTKVTGLNADQLDGRDSTGFYPAGSKVADSAHADNADNAAQLGTLIYRASAPVTVGANGGTAVMLSPPCPTGTRPTGGGVSNDFFGAEVVVSAPWPTNDPVHWWGAVQNHAGFDNTASTYVFCAPVGSFSVASASAAELPDGDAEGSTAPKSDPKVAKN